MIEYKLIKELERNGAHTQRTLATELQVSLGRVNYILTGFTKIGFIQAKKVRDHHDKIRWRYYLTPKGVKEKVRLAKMYLEKLSKEYEMVKEDAK